MARKKKRSKAKATPQTKPQAKAAEAAPKKGVEFHGVTAEAFQKEMEKRREAEDHVKPASFPVVSREDSPVKGDPEAARNPYGIAGWQGEKPHFFPADAYEGRDTDPGEFKLLGKETDAGSKAPQAKRKRGRPPVAVKKKQYTLTMRPDMYEYATQAARERGISFSALVAMALTDYLSKK